MSAKLNHKGDVEGLGTKERRARQI